MSGGRITSSTTSGANRTSGRPGTSATPRPAITKTMDGARLSRLATTAAAANTASMKSSVWAVAVVMAISSGSDQIGDHVYGQCQHHQIEKESEDAVHRHK